MHRKPTEAKAFYAVYAGLIIVAAGLVLTPGAPLGLMTNAVQTLAGVLLPSATVFLLLLCNDKAVLGPWVNKRATNLFTGAVIAVLVLLSIILTASVLFPEAMTATVIVTILAGGALLAVLAAVFSGALKHAAPLDEAGRREFLSREQWRMPPLAELAPVRASLPRRIWMSVLGAYLALAAGLVLLRIVELALGYGG